MFHFFFLQVYYKEEFEKIKGKGFTVVSDTPEMQRIKKTQDQISNVRNATYTTSQSLFCALGVLIP